MWSTVIFDTILGGFVLGMVSILSNLYGESSPYFYRILAFIWAVPLTFFFFVNMASRHGKNKIEDICRHAIIGIVLTFILALSTLYIIKKDVAVIISYSFFFALLTTIGYFAFEIYKY
jgi:hypothetical protein